jgi:membrane protease subunit HflK
MNSSPNDFQTEMDKFKNEMLKHLKTIVTIFVVVVIGGGTLSSFYTVEPDEDAVVIRLGKYVETNPPGLHFKIPFGIDSVIKIKTKRVHQEEFGFRTSGVRDSRTTYNSDSFESESLMLTGDLNVAEVEWVVQYQISDAFKYIFQTSVPTQNIRDVAESIMRRVVGDKLVTEVLTTGRVEIAIKAQELMQQVLDKYDMGIRVVTVKLQDVNPPKLVRASFNEVNEAKQEQEKVINQAEEAYNKVIPEARGKADKQISEAEGYATAVVNRAHGDVEKFRDILVEYKRAPEITKKRIYLETMEKLYSNFDNITIIDPNVKGVLPIYSQDQGGLKNEK